MIRCLIVGPDQDLLDVIEFSLQLELNDNYKFSKNTDLSLIGQITEPEIDIIFSDERYSGKMPDSINAVQVEYFKRSSYQDDVKKILKHLLAFTRKETELPIKEYQKISISLLWRMQEMKSDIYLRLATDRFVKVYKKGDLFEDVDLVKYQTKGIEYLFLNQNDRFVVEKNIITNLQKILSEKKEKSSRVLEAHEYIRGLLQNFGFKREYQEVVQQFFKESIEVFEQNQHLSKLLDSILFKKASYITRHSFILSFVSTTLAKKLEWRSDELNKKLIIASLMHDLFLNDDFQNETEHLLNKNFNDQFRQHPVLAAQLIESIPDIPFETSSIILEQHEIGALGVPYSHPFLTVSPAGLFFSFCHFIVDEIIQLQKDDLEISDLVVFDKMSRFQNYNSSYRKYYLLLKETNLF